MATEQGKCSWVQQALQGDGSAAPPGIEGLYLHVPFCFHKCHYCDFYSIVDDGRHEMFVDRLIGELRLRAAQVRLRPRTLFIGGGTPTLLAVDLWRRLLSAMADLDLLDAVQEFTVEANPETVTADLAATLAAGGVDRLSLGSQSSQGDLLKTLERWHEPQNVHKAVGLARDAGVDNINLDHIFAIPGQSLETLDADIDFALSLQVEHLSYYGLTYEPNTAMTKRLHTGQIRPVAEDMERRMLGRVIDRLGESQFEHYEISNWSHAGRRCEHNLVYWRNGNWLGVGPSAASHVNGSRWRNEPHLGRYLESTGQPPTLDHERLSPARRVGEVLMMGLRVRGGVPLDELSIQEPRQSVIEEMVDLKLLERTETHLRLTDAGLFVADEVVGRLL